MTSRNSNYIDDMIDCYIFQVMKQLTSKCNKDIEAELRTLITDMLEERTLKHTLTNKDIDSVLKELGDPYELAMKYSDKPHYLIGPRLFSAYSIVLKVVLFASILGMFLSIIYSILSSSNIIWYEYAEKQVIWYEFTGRWAANIVNALLSSFASVTLVFAIIERKEVNLKKKSGSVWTPSSLPVDLVRELSIPIRKPISKIIITVIVMVIFAFVPQSLGLYYFTDPIKIIPLFDLKVFPQVLPLFLICFALGLVKNIWKIIDRKISKRYCLFNTIINVMIVGLLTFIFSKFAVFNIDIIIEINKIFHVEHSVVDFYPIITRESTISLFVAIYLIDSIFPIYRVSKYDFKLNNANQ